MVSGVQVLTRLPYPLANEVHIHCVTLATETVCYVSSDEAQRADRLFDPIKKKHFLACHGLLRKILGRYLGLQPEELNFAIGEHGKPYLSHFATDDNNRLHFNLSHSGSLFLLAIATDREVGIDIEQLLVDTPFSDMAQLAFSTREQKELFSLPDNQQRSAFYRCWTRKEAYLKACGMGFKLPSNSFDVTMSRETSVSLITSCDLFRWILQNITVPEDYCAALAVNGSNPILRYIS
jgi:4'-phosphopantetheinyl transferase